MKFFFILFLHLVVSTSCFSMLGCKKTESKSITDQPIKVDPNTKEDITAYGKLSVSIENKNGKESNEGSQKLTDGNINSKFLIYEFKPDCYMQLQFEQPKTVAKYTLTSGDDASGRDPRDWTFSASNDGNNWHILDKQDYEMFNDRNETKQYNLKNSASYKLYRLTIKHNHGDEMFQLSEWRLWFIPKDEQTTNAPTKIDTIEKNNLKLIFVNKAQNLSQDLKQHLIEVFFTNYPKLLKDFNANGKKSVVFSFDPEYDGVAVTSGGIITYSANYMNSHPKDIDVVTHEIMHVIQAYAGGASPSWLTEGIADYVRNKYGVDNVGAGWSMPDYKSGQSYTNSYRITARFLTWLELHIKKGIVKNLDASLRAHTYSSDSWNAETGKSVDDLWAMYAANPEL